MPSSDNSSTENQATIADIYDEQRVFPPPPASAGFSPADRALYEKADTDFETFWATQARELLSWNTDFTKTLEWELPFAKWFSDGTLNVSYNCLDRHVKAGLGDRVAYFFEGEPGDTQTITYAELLAKVERFANVLKAEGLVAGDRVAIYMPMIPELPVAMLACARIGVAHSVIFGGFSPDAIMTRCEDAEAKVLITADAGWRRGQVSPLKPKVDEALAAGAKSVKTVFVVNRCDSEVAMVEGRDIWWHDAIAAVEEAGNTKCSPEPMSAEQLLFLLYTSGTTAKPKGIMHTTAGYLTQVALTHKVAFDLRPETDVYWCAADIGWVTGHSYIVYGPLANGATSILYEGTPDTPRQELRQELREGLRATPNPSNSPGLDSEITNPAEWKKDRWWDIVSRYKVTQLYAAPTAIRTFMKWGADLPKAHDLSSLRVIGSVGEPINPEAWMWYHEHIGNKKCPIIDTWWQTETGAMMITPLPGVTTTKPGSACGTIPGIFAEVVDEAGKKVEQGGGYLTITHPWPSMLRGIWGDPERYKETYWSRFAGRYFAGDGAKIDGDGYLWLLGRVDDVMNISGHRISTTEVESALVDHEAVAEAAVVGAKDDVTGQAIIGYVILREGFEALASDEKATAELGNDIRTKVAQKLGAIARPKAVVIVPDLPKTRSGKIMRRLLKDVVEGRELGDTTTLADSAVVAEIQSKKATSSDDD